MEDVKKPVVINLFAGAGCGKSTLCAFTFAKLKMLGYNCEQVTEFAKDKVWEQNNVALSNQLYVFAKQHYRVARCADKVDVVITDSPLLLSGFYNRDPDIDAPLKELIRRINAKYTNVNYFLRRIKPYNPVGRLETKEQAMENDDKIRNMLDQYGEPYTVIDGNLMSADIIVDNLQSLLKPEHQLALEGK